MVHMASPSPLLPASTHPLLLLDSQNLQALVYISKSVNDNALIALVIMMYRGSGCWPLTHARQTVNRS